MNPRKTAHGELACRARAADGAEDRGTGDRRDPGWCTSTWKNQADTASRIGHRARRHNTGTAPEPRAHATAPSDPAPGQRTGEHPEERQPQTHRHQQPGPRHTVPGEVPQRCPSPVSGSLARRPAHANCGPRNHPVRLHGPPPRPPGHRAQLSGNLRKHAASAQYGDPHTPAAAKPTWAATNRPYGEDQRRARERHPGNTAGR